MIKKVEETYISRRNNAFMVEKKTCALDTNNSRAHSPFQWVFKIENSKEMRDFLSSLKDSLQFLIDNSKFQFVSSRWEDDTESTSIPGYSISQTNNDGIMYQFFEDNKTYEKPPSRLLNDKKRFSEILRKQFPGFIAHNPFSKIKKLNIPIVLVPIHHYVKYGEFSIVFYMDHTVFDTYSANIFLKLLSETCSCIQDTEKLKKKYTDVNNRLSFSHTLNNKQISDKINSNKELSEKVNTYNPNLGFYLAKMVVNGLLWGAGIWFKEVKFRLNQQEIDKIKKSYNNDFRWCSSFEVMLALVYMSIYQEDKVIGFNLIVDIRSRMKSDEGNIVIEDYYIGNGASGVEINEVPIFPHDLFKTIESIHSAIRATLKDEKIYDNFYVYEGVRQFKKKIISPMLATLMGKCNDNFLTINTWFGFDTESITYGLPQSKALLLGIPFMPIMNYSHFQHTFLTTNEVTFSTNVSKNVKVSIPDQISMAIAEF